MKQLIECVPNFSEGNDARVIEQIAAVVREVEGVSLLNVDPGKATNRTVITFAGAPEPVKEAAFRAIKKAAELIDMRRHKGAHPRFGATDVCPLIPVSGITMEETAEHARMLARRVGEELQIPVYLYERAATSPERANLANCRAGEYEGLAKHMEDPGWQPDHGPRNMNERVAKTGATAIGARDFLVAYNVNLNTTSARLANAVAFDVRERGRALVDPATGKKMLDENGKTVMKPGTLKAVKAIGWYIEEYGVAQISMNLTDISATPVHAAFDETCRKAAERGLRVTGSELVGLVPLRAMLDAGRYFLRKQQRSTGVPDSELIKIAVKSLGLDDLAPFNPRERVIEYLLEDEERKGTKRLAEMSLAAFIDETSSESPAPGGGSIAACMGALGAALAGMVANLSARKRGWDDRWEEFSDQAERAKAHQTELLKLVDEDTAAFNRLMAAYELPKKSDEEKQARHRAIQEATRHATEAPLRTMTLCHDSMEVIRAMAEKGNPNSVTDAGVGALAARAGALGAFLNVKVNAAGLDDRDLAETLLRQGEELVARTCEKESEILAIVRGKI
ncbi:MAG: glutamate formimidoyltransferase [Odoribacteraceae bacterium]|jgi:glutamate formiminotransferase/formiminotetrahydrofolate cyclodeaminase|nr:glutamate formimidoyltransferase [Odoribacteraceae bacterium]